MIRSMTGFGSASGPVGSSHVSIELRSVNHRFFSPSIKLPASLARFEPEVRERLRQRVGRGHVTLSMRVDRPEGPGAVIDEAAFAERAVALVALQRRHGLGGTVDVGTVLRMPDVFRSAAADDYVVGTVDEVVAVVDAASASLGLTREAEGIKLAAVITGRIDLMAETLGRIAARAPHRIRANLDRLRENVKALLDGRAPDEQRLAQEIALIAERLDAGEEIDRFTAHLSAIRETLSAAADGGVGKRLGFLLQELLREANTIGSKANDAGMQAEVVLLKEELERVREQVENLE